MVLNSSEKVSPSIAQPPHYLHELSEEDEERLSKIFNNLDVNGNGKIDIYDLSASLKQYGVSHGDAQVIFS